MVSTLFNQPTYVAGKKLLDVAEMRQSAIAANLSNLETPNYRRVDIAPTFSTELDQALRGGNAGQIASLQPKVAVDLTATAANRDGNTVQLENELMAMGQNTLAHNFETQLVSGKLLQLRMAITGRPV